MDQSQIGRRAAARRRATAAAAVAAIALLGGATTGAGPAAAHGGPQARPDTAPRLTAASFADPPATVRPKYRWWLPLAYEQDEQLVRELGEMKEAGAGGAEVAAFTVDGRGNQSSPFLDRYGWGTPEWSKRMETVYGAANDLGLRVDMSIGPRWPALVPSVSDLNDPRAAQQIVFGRAFAKGGTSFDGPLPSNYDARPPAGARTTLVAALVARCVAADCDAQSGSPRLLDPDSVVDVTGEVGPDGTLAHALPGDAGSTWALIAFWQTASGETRTGLTATTPNYYLDHLSEAGARASTDFWDEHVLTPELRRQIGTMGDADLYEDSLELGSTQKWTWDYLAQWRARRGYDPVRLLPAIAGAGQHGLNGAPFFDFPGGLGARVRTDYRQTWSDLYVDVRLRALHDWAHGNGMSVRAQPYGGPIDVAGASSHVDVPEGESLAFNNNVEDYKTVAVGAHLNGRAVVSDECCAMRDAVWATTAAGHADPANLQAIYRGLAGGVTQVVWHGFPHLTRGPLGSGVNAIWPGMTYGGNATFGEAWGAKGGPNWEDQRSINDSLGRLQLVLRQGTPRFDLAVYWQDFGLDGHGTTGAGSHTLLRSRSPLAAAGYTWEYLSPANLREHGATVRRGQLFPDASGYRALLLKDQRTMSVEIARTLLARVRDGLPVVVVGALPSATPGARDTTGEDAELRAVIARLASERRVVRVAEEADVPAALRRLGIEAAAAHVSAPSDPSILSVRRQADGVDYWFLYNQGATAVDQTLRLAAGGTAYRLDPWSGEIAPLETARTRGGTVDADVRLEGDDVTVIAVTRRRDGTFGGAAHRVDREDGPLAAAARGGHGGGQGAAPAPRRLTDWSLAVERWTPGPSGLPGDTAKTPLEPVAVSADARGALPAWTEITPANGYGADLQDASGFGTYTARLRLDRDWDGVTGAWLDLGRVADTATVTVNGRALPPLNPADVRHVEVGSRLRRGDNTIVVRVASTLLNAVRVAPGTGASGRARQAYGLLGPVTLTPHAATRTVLTAEPLETALPLADGGWNRAQVRVANGGRRPARVSLEATTDAGGRIDVRPSARTLLLRGGESRLVAVELRADGVAAGESTLTVRARTGGGHGHGGGHRRRGGRGGSTSGATSATATVALRHTDDVARNDAGTPFPRISVSTNQDRYPGDNLNDGLESTFWVSGGLVPGQAPSPSEPQHVTLDFGAPVTAGSVRFAGRTSYGPRDYEVQVARDGRDWTTVARVEGAPRAGATTTFAPVRTRWLRMRITGGYYTATPGNNVQSSALEVRAR